jgi:hypothetical protein
MPGLAAFAAASPWRQSRPAPALARCAVRPPQPPRRWGRWRLPELRRYRYSGALATGTIAAGGTLGILIPPSVVLIVYAIIVEVNIVTMFAAALIPGCWRRSCSLASWRSTRILVPEAGPKGEAVSASELVNATIATIPVLVIFRRRHRRHLCRHLQSDRRRRHRRGAGRRLWP